VPVQFEGGVSVTSQCLKELWGLGELFNIFYFFRYYDTSMLGIPCEEGAGGAAGGAAIAAEEPDEGGVRGGHLPGLTLC
jgi:hypothetical protein